MQTPARLESAENANPEKIPARKRVAAGEIRLQRAERKEEIKIFADFQTKEAGRGYAEDFGQASRNNQLFADGEILPAKLALPQSVTDHNARRAAPGLHFFRAEEAASMRPQSEG